MRLTWITFRVMSLSVLNVCFCLTGIALIWVITDESQCYFPDRLSLRLLRIIFRFFCPFFLRPFECLRLCLDPCTVHPHYKKDRYYNFA